MKFLTTLICFSLLFMSCDPSLMDPVSAYQPKKYKGKYADKMEAGSTVLVEHYHQTVERTKEGKFIRKQFYSPKKQITHFETYADKKLRIKDGITKNWMDNGNLFFEGQYVNGNREGEWKHYDIRSGFLNSIGKYEKGLSSGTWKYLREDGTTYAEYNFQEGKRHGAYQLFNKEGTLVEEGTYKNGEPDTQNKLNGIEGEANGEVYKIVETMPMFKNEDCIKMTDKLAQKKCAEEKMLRFIYSNIKYPRFAREQSIEGSALASFVIDKKGKVIETKIHRGVCLDIHNEVARVIDMMPDWVAGTQKGEPVKVFFNLPVRFKLH